MGLTCTIFISRGRGATKHEPEATRVCLQARDASLQRVCVCERERASERERESVCVSAST